MQVRRYISAHLESVVKALHWLFVLVKIVVFSLSRIIRCFGTEVIQKNFIRFFKHFRNFRVAFCVLAIFYTNLALCNDKSQEILPTQAQNLEISEISFVHEGRTQLFVLQRELTLKVGQRFELEEFNESMRKLRALPLFYEVIPLVFIQENRSIKISIQVKELWTTSPVFLIGGGGGVSYFTLGLQDINVLGRFLEVGARYVNFDGAHAGGLWFRNPRFLDRQLRISSEIMRQNRTRELYTPSAQRIGAYNLVRRKFSVGIDNEFFPFVTLGVGYEFDGDDFSQNHLTKVMRDENMKFGFVQPRDSNSHILRLIASVGRIRNNSYVFEGFLSESLFEATSTSLGSADDFFKVTQTFLAHYSPIEAQTLSMRLAIGLANTPAIQHQFFIGGLESIRGFKDGQFRGKRYWLSNIEYRVPSVVHRVFVMQHIFFADAASAANTWSKIAPSAKTSGFSIGTGVRFVSPIIHRFTLRADYAWALVPHKTSGLSFGIQQFF